MNFAEEDEYERANPVYDMVDQVLQNLVRQRTFNFQQVAEDVNADFGVTMSAEDVRRRFARLEIGSPAAKVGAAAASTAANDVASEASDDEEPAEARAPPVAPQASVRTPPTPAKVEEEKGEEKTHADPQAARSPPQSTASNDGAVLSMPSAAYMEALLAELSVEQQSMAEGGGAPSDPNEPKSEMQQVLDILNAPEEEQAPATMESLFGISEAEFHEQVKEMERQHQQVSEQQQAAAEAEKGKREAGEDFFASSTEESMRRSLARTKGVFDRVVKALGIEEEGEQGAVVADDAQDQWRKKKRPLRVYIIWLMWLYPSRWKRKKRAQKSV